MLRASFDSEAIASSFQSPSEVSDVLSQLDAKAVKKFVSIPFRGFRRAETETSEDVSVQEVSIPFRGFRRAEFC